MGLFRRWVSFIEMGLFHRSGSLSQKWVSFQIDLFAYGVFKIRIYIRIYRLHLCYRSLSQKWVSFHMGLFSYGVFKIRIYIRIYRLHLCYRSLSQKWVSFDIFFWCAAGAVSALLRCRTRRCRKSISKWTKCMRWVAVCCSSLQCVAVCCSVLQ